MFLYFYIFVGYLCGKCSNDAGVSALSNKCVSCGNVNILLIFALGTSTISYTYVCDLLCQTCHLRTLWQRTVFIING